MKVRDDLLDKIINLKIQHRNTSFQHWLSIEVFSWVWWVEVIVIISVFALWLKLLDRKRLLQIIIFGFFVNIAATFLDVMGSEYCLWEYRIRVIPQLPLIYPVDFVILPIVDMLIYQYSNTWKKYLIWSTVAAAVLAFILEPFSVYINQYILIKWEYIYSFPIYIIISIFAKFVTDWIVKLKIQSTENK